MDDFSSAIRDASGVAGRMDHRNSPASVVSRSRGSDVWVLSAQFYFNRATKVVQALWCVGDWHAIFGYW